MRRIPPLLALVAVVACNADPFFPSAKNMSGDYTAHFISTTDSSGTVDWIAAGASLTLSLGADGSASGRLFVPGGAAGGGDLDADMAGTWLLVGGTITFGQTADTFVRNMDFVPSRNRLSGDHTFSDGTRVQVVLTK